MLVGTLHDTQVGSSSQRSPYVGTSVLKCCLPHMHALRDGVYGAVHGESCLTDKGGKGG